MKAVVLSDSHGSFNNLVKAVENEKDVSMLIFAGDVQRDADKLVRAYPRLPAAVVLGNNDWSVRDVPFDRTFNFAGRRVFLTHGHKYHVKYGLNTLLLKAREENADICVFGHTHRAYCEEVSGVFMLNPGSAWLTYAVLEIDENGKISAEIKETP